MYKLTQREEEVLCLVLKGYTNREIADILCISTHTSKVHISSLYQKFKVSNRVELVVKLLIFDESGYKEKIIKNLTIEPFKTK